MRPETRANFLAGEWRPAQSGARFGSRRGAPEETWPQSSSADVFEAWSAARAAGAAWRRRDPEERLHFLLGLARVLARDEVLLERLGRRLGLEPEELRPHLVGLEAAVQAAGASASLPAGGVAWCAPDWRDLVRSPLLDLARELVAGRCAVLVSDARLPELTAHLASAAQAAELPAGVLGLLHGAPRELLALALSGPESSQERVLVASGPVESMAELRRLEQGGAVQARLRPLRSGAAEIEAGGDLEMRAAEIVERAFGRGTTVGGQLPGALARVYCPTRLFSRFSECFLAQLETSAAVRTPVALIDAESATRVRAAWKLGLDEGATCIAGGDERPDPCLVPPTVFTNVEPFMASAKRQDPLPVLCLLRGW